ncbi:MAG: cytosine/adenosine deaminase-related metal-dependent hydrolase [Candidatus Nitrosomirales archaeon]|jgi:cytosine/adenosine deaminase-related metal-dependent hydrolase
MLYGRDLEFIQSGYAVIQNGIFTKVGSGSFEYDGEVYDAEGLLMIPGLINAHTHIADSIAKDVAADHSFNETIHPIHGIKRSILASSKQEHIATYMQTAVLSMVKKGITTFADFREGAMDGITLLKNAMNDVEARCLALGRVEYYYDADSAKKNNELPEHAKRTAELVIGACEGFGISGANEYSDSALEYFAKTARSHNKLLGIHAAEAQESSRYSMQNFGRSEVSRIIAHMKPDFVVHMTNATDDDIKLAATNNTGIVVCPRANGVLGVGLPRIASMLKQNCTLAVGTDNVMLNSPDLFRELDYIWKTCRAVEHQFVSAKELLKMVTVNAAKILKLEKLGCIAENMIADAVFIDKHSLDLEPMHDPYTSIVHRVSESSIRAVMRGGRFVHGSL